MLTIDTFIGKLIFCKNSCVQQSSYPWSLSLPTHQQASSPSSSRRGWEFPLLGSAPGPSLTYKAGSKTGGAVSSAGARTGLCPPFLHTLPRECSGEVAARGAAALLTHSELSHWLIPFSWAAAAPGSPDLSACHRICSEPKCWTLCFFLLHFTF